jgi:acetyltransferase-like isoleucine patch superfamily enzyme
MKSFFLKIVLHFYTQFQNYKRSIILNNLKKCGVEVHIGYYTSFQNIDLITIGDFTQISDYTVLLGANKIDIGCNCRISTNCMISSISHKINSKNRINDDFINIDQSSLSIKIGNNVWIGSNSVILPGTKIGDNCIIGAGSVVRGQIPNNQIWIGSPATFKKHIIFE